MSASIPLSEAVAAQLSDPTSALAAAFVIGTRHPEILIWVSRMLIGGAEPVQPKPHAARSNGSKPARKSARLNGYLAERRAQRDRDDEGLVRAMRDSPDGPIGSWAVAIGRSRTSTVTALHRLRDVGLAESVDGKWRLIEEPSPKEPPAKWT